MSTEEKAGEAAPSVVPTKSQQRYDRQLRLWGDHGQEALEAAHICLINATAMGTETLKNLVLPGLGAFTVIDHNLVKQSDLGSNFFLRTEDLGKNRASAAVEVLCEMNDSVKGTAREESFEEIFASDPDFFRQFSFVLVCDTPLCTLSPLAAFLWENKIPLSIGKTWGLFGLYQVFTQEHEVIEAHAEGFDDLRLLNPFPELVAHVESVDLKALSNEEFERVPFPVLILKFMEEWKAAHDGKVPSVYKEKKEFSKLLATKERKSSSGPAPNFKEAKAKCNRSLIPFKISESIEELFQNESCTVTAESSDFWWICAALKEFFEATGTLPLVGSISDMEGGSQGYVALQRVYKQKAEADVDQVMSTLNTMAARLSPGRTFDRNLVARFCKNSRDLSTVRTLPFAFDGYSTQGPHASAIEKYLTSADTVSAAMTLVLLYGCDSFHAQEGYWPGDAPANGDLKQDEATLTGIATDMLSAMGVAVPAPKDLIAEICRHGASQLHTTASVIGGVISQEIVKFMTSQYVPIGNTFVFDGITSKGEILAL